jgi:hypothetical protein
MSLPPVWVSIEGWGVTHCVHPSSHPETRTLCGHLVSVNQLSADTPTRTRCQVGDFTDAAEFPLATRCGVILRCRVGAAVCMKPSTRVSCTQCRRITGINETPADNTDLMVTR